MKAWIAQLVEQWIEDPRVTGSNPVLGISNNTLIKINYVLRYFVRFLSNFN